MGCGLILTQCHLGNGGIVQINGGSMDTDEYLRAILKKQETTNEWLKWCAFLLAAIVGLLAGSRFGWFSFAVTVAN